MASPQLLSMDSRRKHERIRSHGLRARITIFLLNLLGLRFWIQQTSCITRIVARGYLSKWMQAMQDGERALIRWYTRGRDPLMRKAEEGKATRDQGKSFNGPAKRGLPFSLSSLSFTENHWQGYWRWRDIGISLKPTWSQGSPCTPTTSLDCTRTV